MKEKRMDVRGAGRRWLGARRKGAEGWGQKLRVRGSWDSAVGIGNEWDVRTEEMGGGEGM